MPLPDELEKLNALHERGALTDEEFALAKKRLLEGAPDEGQRASAKPPETNSALNRLHRSIDDRWIGGVHLEGQAVPWRWDADAGARPLVSR